MSIPGMNLEPENEPVPNEISDPVNTPEQDDDDIVVAEKNAKGEDVAPVSAVLKYKTQTKSLKAEVARLQAENQQAAAVKARLDELAPILGRIQQDPSILDRVRLPQQRQEEDTEAKELAEDMGFITAGGELDVTRARRVLNKIEQRAGHIADQRVAPVRQTSAVQQSNSYKAALMMARDQNTGAPLVTPETIEELFAMLPAELTANEHVAHKLLLPLALGLDRQKGRTPKADPRRDYGDPIFSEAAGRGGRNASVLTDDDKRFAKGLGLDEKQFAKQVEQMQTNGRRGVALE